MEILEKYLLEKKDDGYILVIYLNSNSTEFSSDVFDSSKEIYKDLKTWLMSWSRTLAPKIKIHTIRIMMGTFLLVAFPIPTNISMMNNSIQVNQINAQTIKKFNMSYLYFGSPSSQIEKVLRTNNAIQVITPNYFDLTDEGNLQLTSQLNTYFIQEMHSNGIRVVPFLSNHWDQSKGIKALENRDQLVNDIINAIETYNLDGINVDIENVTPAQRDMYTDLVKQLRERLPSDKEVSVAVAANPYGWTGGWHGSYDYSGLSQYADYLMIMAYDQSYYGSLPGPVASHDFVEQSLVYALEHAPAEKVVLGISFYGRYWNEELGIAGNGIHLTKIKELLDTYENEVTYDQYFQAPKAEIRVKPGDPPVYVFGKPLAPGTYTIWYENNDSIKDKLMLVQKYNIKGTGNWSLGQELNDVWSYYNLWLNGQYFEDINESWAKDDIIAVVEKQLMKGVTDTRFAPKDTLTRAQAATILVRELGLQSLNLNHKDYTDVPSTHWAKENINIITDHGFMLGTSSSTFSPDKPLTREQMAMLLYRVLEHDAPTDATEPSYTDVEPNRWSSQAINAISKLGIYKGYPDKTFRPTNSMERQEMAALMNRISDD